MPTKIATTPVNRMIRVYILARHTPVMSFISILVKREAVGLTKTMLLFMADRLIQRAKDGKGGFGYDRNGTGSSHLL
jgi:hypothetical protein